MPPDPHPSVKPPRWLKPLNKALLALRAVGGLRELPVLTVAGRCSQKPRRTPLTVLTLDGCRYVLEGFPGADWARNVRAARGGGGTDRRAADRAGVTDRIGRRVSCSRASSVARDGRNRRAEDHERCRRRGGDQPGVVREPGRTLCRVPDRPGAVDTSERRNRRLSEWLRRRFLACRVLLRAMCSLSGITLRPGACAAAPSGACGR